MFAGLQLVDGPWFGYDIDRLPRVPDVVLLSACEVGRSTVRWGEELIGMTTAWLHAGARCVIASPAAINDQAAYDVLVAVHERLAAGLDPAAALAAAVPAVAADAPPGAAGLLRLSTRAGIWRQDAAPQGHSGRPLDLRGAPVMSTMTTTRPLLST